MVQARSQQVKCSTKTVLALAADCQKHELVFCRTGAAEINRFVILSVSTNGVPREYHGQCLSFVGQILVELNLDILVR